MLAGIPRRVPDYPDAYTGFNIISSFGSIVSVISAFLFLYILFDILSKPQYDVSRDNWHYPSYFNSNTLGVTESASSLEFVLESPPAFHAYTTLPVQS